MKPALVAVVVIALMWAAVDSTAQRSARLLGFTVDGTDREVTAERIMAAVPDVEKMKEIHAFRIMYDEGREEEVRTMLIRLGRRRFGSPRRRFNRRSQQ